MLKFQQIVAPTRWPLLVLAIGAFAWLVLLVTAPIAPLPLAALAYAAGARVCHQLASRSFHFGGAQLAVCARCTGIYAGAALAFVWTLVTGPTGPSVLRNRLVLAVGLLPTAITVLAELTGLRLFSNGERAAAGIALGVAVALVAGWAATLHYQRWPQRPRA